MITDYYATHYPSLVKQAGFWTELPGTYLNPLNAIGTPIGMAAALATPTRNLREQATSNIDDTWSNLLMPGKGAYNAMKRTGWSIRGPELEAARAAAEAKASKEPASKEPEDDDPQHPDDPGFEEKLKQHMDDNNLKYSAARDLLVCANALTKQGGYYTELLSSLNPLTPYSFGGTAGLIAATATPTKNIKELAEQDSKSWSNVLLPGVGPYRAMKRVGTSIRGPEMKAMEEQIKRERAEDSSGTTRLSDNLQGIREAIEAGAPGSLAKLQASGQEKEKAAAVQYLLGCASSLQKQAGPMDWLGSAAKGVGNAVTDAGSAIGTGVGKALGAPGKWYGEAANASANKELAKPAPDPRMTSSQARMQAFGAGASGQGNRAVTSTEQFNPDATTRSGQLAGMKDQRNVQRGMQSRDSDVSSAAYARAQSNPRYNHLLEGYNSATASYQLPERDATQQVAKPISNPGWQGGNTAAAPPATQLPARGATQQPVAQQPASSFYNTPIAPSPLKDKPPRDTSKYETAEVIPNSPMNVDTTVNSRITPDKWHSNQPSGASDAVQKAIANMKVKSGAAAAVNLLKCARFLVKQAH